MIVIRLVERKNITALRMLTVWFLCNGAVSVGQPVATFLPLGDLPGGNFESYAASVSDDGTVVVGVSDTDTGLEAFRWTAATGMVGLGVLPGGSVESEAFAVSGDGMVIVGIAMSNTTDEAFRWTANEGMTAMGDFPGGGFHSTAGAVSADGSVIAGAGFSDLGQRAFRWTETDGMVSIGGGDSYGMTPDGLTIVGVGFFNGLNEAFRWTAATGMVGLGDLPGGQSLSFARDISVDGSVVFGGSKSAVGGMFTEGFRWTAAGGMIGLGIPPDIVTSEVHGISGDGSRAVGWFEFYWDQAHGVIDLQVLLANEYGLNLLDTGYDWSIGCDMTPDGHTIAGVLATPRGDLEAGLIMLPCFGDAECDDVNACTQDTCVNNRCQHASLCDDGNACTSDRCVAGVCKNTPISQYGDVTLDAAVNIFDLFCVLDGFAGDFTACPFADQDVEPCGGNGTINVFDIFAVLNAFSGTDPCCSGP